MKARSHSPPDNNQSSISKIAIPELFNFVKKVQVGGIEGYNIPRKYISLPRKISPVNKNITYLESKQENTLKKIVKSPFRESYFDKQIEMAAEIPSSAKYSCNQPKKWAISAKELEKMDKKLIQLHYHTDRRTYVDDIKIHESRNGSLETRPRRTTHESTFKKLNQTERDQNEIFYLKQSSRERTTLLDDKEYLGDSTPGPGQYNPHKSIKKIQVDNRDLNYWKEKHSAPSPRHSTFLPGVGDYYHQPAYQTFEKMQRDREAKQTENTLIGVSSKIPKMIKLLKQGVKYLHHGFGTQQRIEDSKQSITPGPGSHNLIEQWESKNSSYDQFSRKGSPPQRGLNPMKHVSKGIEKSIYYDKLPLIN